MYWILFQKIHRDAPTSLHVDLQTTYFWSCLLQVGKLHFKFQKKKHENENYLKKNLQETFLRIVSKEKWYFVQFCTTDHWLPDILNESRRELFQMVLCQGQNYNAVCCHTQFTTTQRSNAFKLNHYFFFNNQSLFRLQEAEVAAGSCRGLHRDGGEASREDVLLYFLQGCCFFH